MRSTTPPLRAARPAAAACLVLAVALTGACGSSSSDSSPAATSSASTAASAAAPTDASTSAAAGSPAATSPAPTSPAAASPAPSSAAPATSAAAPGSGTTTGTVFRTAAEATRATSARITITQSTVPGSGKATTLTETGVLDFRTTTGTLSLKPVGATEPITVILLGKTIYTKIPGGGTSGKTWVKSALPAGATTDPSASLSYLDTAVSNVKRVGTAQIGGTSTTEYTATVDPIKALGPSATGAAASALKQAGITSATVSIYVDSSGRYRRQVTKLVAKSYPSLSGGKAGPATLTTVQDLTDYGIAVHVTAPPASQVQSLAG